MDGCTSGGYPADEKAASLWGTAVFSRAGRDGFPDPLYRVRTGSDAPARQGRTEHQKDFPQWGRGREKSAKALAGQQYLIKEPEDVRQTGSGRSAV